MGGDLPSYDDVLREDAQRTQGSSSVAPTRPPRPTRPTKQQSAPAYPPRPVQQAPQAPAPPAAPALPWQYPRGFHCSKCNNTGYKIKNGRSCKTCWRRFAPPNNSGRLPPLTMGMRTIPFSPFRPMSMGGQSMAPISTGRGPLVVQPGDPRLGGVVCGECRGSGRVSFLLDEDICPLCRGIGRIIT